MILQINNKYGFAELQAVSELTQWESEVYAFGVEFAKRGTENFLFDDETADQLRKIAGQGGDTVKLKISAYEPNQNFAYIVTDNNALAVPVTIKFLAYLPGSFRYTRYESKYGHAEIEAVGDWYNIAMKTNVMNIEEHGHIEGTVFDIDDAERLGLITGNDAAYLQMSITYAPDSETGKQTLDTDRVMVYMHSKLDTSRVRLGRIKSMAFLPGSAFDNQKAIADEVKKSGYNYF